MEGVSGDLAFKSCQAEAGGWGERAIERGFR